MIFKRPLNALFDATSVMVSNRTHPQYHRERDGVISLTVNEDLMCETKQCSEINPKTFRLYLCVNLLSRF